MMHAVTALSQDSPKPAGWDVLAEVVRQAEKNQDHSLGPQLDGLAIRCVSVKGDPSQAFLQTAQAEQVDLIMMSPHGHTFNWFLLYPGTACGTRCPIWISTHVEESPVQEFAVRNVLCVVDFGFRSHKTVSWAAAMAAEFGARLTLAFVTASVEHFGPGGSYADPVLKEELVGDASMYLAKLQQDMGIKAELFIGSGDVPKALSQAAKQTQADLLVVGCYPYGGNLGIHGYAIIRALPIPVLNV